MTLSHRLRSYLESWHKTSTTRKRNQGIKVDLSFDAFTALFSQKQFETLENAIWHNRLVFLQNRANRLAFVLTWRSYAARSTNVFNSETAMICCREKSARINKAGAGDVLRPAHAAKIRKALTGKPKTAKHRNNISKGCKGKPKVQWTDDRKAERRALNEAKRSARAAISDAPEAHGLSYST
jgi:hypothetical protein